jgi:hypothetical protein
MYVSRYYPASPHELAKSVSQIYGTDFSVSPILVDITLTHQNDIIT